MFGKKRKKISELATHNNLAFLISARLGSAEGSAFSTLITRIAVASIGLGLAAISLSFMIFEGFKNEIQEKIFSFSAHFHISKFDANDRLEVMPIPTTRNVYKLAKTLPNVASIQEVSQKPALLKTNEEIMGVMMKGVSRDYDTARFAKNLVQGSFIVFNDSTPSTNLVVSQQIANKLNLKLNDSLIVFFIQNPPRYRKMNIVGIYQTGLEDFDRIIILGDNRLIKRLNNWADSMTGGLEVYLKDFDKADQTAESLFDLIDYDMGMEAVTDRFIHFFDWFIMLKRNVFIFLSIILFVAAFNTISVLLILIMERTNMIGTLKALGATNALLKRIFMINGLRIAAKGLLLGNVLTFGLAAAQYYLKIIPLNPENYYMAHVPISWEWTAIVGVNVLMFSLITLTLLIPVRIIASVQPIKAIRFD